MKKFVFFLILIAIILTAEIEEELQGPLINEKNHPENDNIKEDVCDFISDQGICLFEGKKLIVSDAKPKGLIAYYNFDDSEVLDLSGNQNHGKNSIPAGPSLGGIGYSANFNGFDFVEIPHIPIYNTKTYSITFWLYVIFDEGLDSTKNKGLEWCPILQKGEDDSFEKTYFRSPGIFIDKANRRLKVMVSTNEAGNHPMGETLDSNARLNYNKWYFISVIRDQKKLKLYVNGILDAITHTIGFSTTNTMPYYIGNVPWHKDDCNVPTYMDDLRIYNRVLKEFEIEAEGAPSLGGIEPSFVLLGCINCPAKQAESACANNYHICTSIELNTGGYHVARSMGWLNWNTKVWSHSSINKKKKGGRVSENIPDLALGICCMDLR